MFFMPQQIPLDHLPSQVTICEVGPRDGLQNEKGIVSVDVKLEFIERLAGAGHRLIEVTSFVHPKWVPQLADAEHLLDRLTRVPGVRYPVLVPNARGFERALDRSITDICMSVGFSSLGTFSRTFRDIVGESPKEYRAAHPLVARVPTHFSMAWTRPSDLSSFGEERDADPE